MSFTVEPCVKDGSSDSLFKLDSGMQDVSHGTSDMDFAHTVSYISRGNFIPEKKQYPSFKKTFWEEPMYNPPLATASQDHAYEAYIKEQDSYWKRKGKIFDTQKRLVPPKPANERGPVKAPQYPHFFEKGEKYFGRKRKILPYLRAQLYTRPIERCDPEARNEVCRRSNKVLVGPGTYDVGDYWNPKSYSTVGPPVRPSSFMETKSKRDLHDFYGIRSKEYNKSPPVSSAPTCHTQSLFPTSSASMTHSPSDMPKGIGPLPSTPVDRNKRRTHSAGEARPRSPGMVFNKSSLEPCGLSADVHFVRMKQSNGSNFIVPVSKRDEEKLQCIHDAKPIDTWAQPNTPKKDLVVASSPAPGVYANKWSFNESSAVDVTDSSEQPVNSPVVSEGAASRQARSKGATVTGRLPTPNFSRNSTKEHTGPSVPTRTLSYEQLRNEKKFASFVNPNPKVPTKVSLCVSERAVVSPGNKTSLDVAGEDRDDIISKASQRSLDILMNFELGEGH